jgi:putative endonuclease
MWQWFQRLCGFGRRADAGARGEAQAAEWLRRERAFAIVTRNWRNPRDRRDELDLICRDGETLVFVEVKTRAADALVPGYYAVDRRKKRVVRRAAKAYLAQLAKRPGTFRFDVVEVALKADGREPEILHFENVPLFSKFYRG